MCTKFHAFTTKCTIPAIMGLYPLDHFDYLVYISRASADMTKGGLASLARLE